MAFANYGDYQPPYALPKYSDPASSPYGGTPDVGGGYGAYQPPYMSGTDSGGRQPGTYWGDPGVGYGGMIPGANTGAGTGPGGSTPYIGGAGDPNNPGNRGATYSPFQDPTFRVGEQNPNTQAGANPAAQGGVQNFINDWHMRHNPQEGAGGLFDALKQQYGIDRWNDPQYGASNNEINLGGQKYKVLGGEGTSNAYWYRPGMNDSAPQAPVSSVAMPSGVQPQTSGLQGPTLPQNDSSYADNSLTARMKGPTTPGQYWGGNQMAYQPPYMTGAV